MPHYEDAIGGISAELKDKKTRKSFDLIITSKFRNAYFCEEAKIVETTHLDWISCHLHFMEIKSNLFMGLFYTQQGRRKHFHTGAARFKSPKPTTSWEKS